MGFAKENIYDLAFVGSGVAPLHYTSFIDILEHVPLNQKSKY
jgi:hypothetical protein